VPSSADRLQHSDPDAVSDAEAVERQPEARSEPAPRPAPQPAPNPSAPAQTLDAVGPHPVITWVLDTVGTARNTQHLLDLLQQLKGGQPLGQQDLQAGFGRFPVLGYVWYQNDFGAPRYRPFFTLHEGVDLFAVAGTPISAVSDGIIAKLADGSVGGISIWLVGDDGITYYYGHMRGYAPGVTPGLRVRVGDVIGYVGDSGATYGTYPHLHFEMHPGGGPAVTPKPVLDAWLNEAETNALAAIARIVEFNQLNRIGAARWQSVFDLLREPAAPVEPLWPIALDPSASSLGMQIAFDGIAWSMDVHDANVAQGIGNDEAATPMVADLMRGPSWLTLSGGSALAGPRAAVG